MSDYAVVAASPAVSLCPKFQCGKADTFDVAIAWFTPTTTPSLHTTSKRSTGQQRDLNAPQYTKKLLHIMGPECDSGKLAQLADLAPALPAQKHFPDAMPTLQTSPSTTSPDALVTLPASASAPIAYLPLGTDLMSSAAFTGTNHGEGEVVHLWVMQGVGGMLGGKSTHSVAGHALPPASGRTCANVGMYAGLLRCVCPAGVYQYIADDGEGRSWECRARGRGRGLGGDEACYQFAGAFVPASHPPSFNLLPSLITFDMLLYGGQEQGESMCDDMKSDVAKLKLKNHSTEELAESARRLVTEFVGNFKHQHVWTTTFSLTTLGAHNF
ncbi:hypothetical protein B0H10DRAFT_1947031 [Mycena sp. CBHHK59/15]|nr:hypothetical protein B0H10DRAFT_1947031 [Mycena sp. CBHHK59/15]